MMKVNNLKQYVSRKILSSDDAMKKISFFKEQGNKVGLCHGGFDLIHPGHFKHFESAKGKCDVLFVSITADNFVTDRKGFGRPIYTENLRAYMTACCEFVDFVVISNYKLGVDVINLLKPNLYIKGPDFINKNTPGITAEREAILGINGEMVYTTEDAMSTTGIIEYIKNVVDRKEVLLVIDRDGTIIENNDFFGKNDNWKEELKYNLGVVNALSTLQTKYNTTKVVVTNQGGVARKLFDCKRVEEINKQIDLDLKGLGIRIDNWQYCPDIDSKYASLHPEFDLDKGFVKDVTKRKPSTQMVLDSLKELGKGIESFSKVIVLGDREEDGNLSKNLGANFIDVNGKGYDEIISQAKTFLDE